LREVAAPRIGGAREQGRRWRRLGLVARASRGWTADGSGGGAQGEYGRGFGDRGGRNRGDGGAGSCPDPEEGRRRVGGGKRKHSP
jgi:hypothetical protein